MSTQTAPVSLVGPVGLPGFQSRMLRQRGQGRPGPARALFPFFPEARHHECVPIVFREISRAGGLCPTLITLVIGILQDRRAQARIWSHPSIKTHIEHLELEEQDGRQVAMLGAATRAETAGKWDGWWSWGWGERPRHERWSLQRNDLRDLLQIMPPAGELGSKCSNREAVQDVSVSKCNGSRGDTKWC